jgi:hypothetical protein
MMTAAARAVVLLLLCSPFAGCASAPPPAGSGVVESVAETQLDQLRQAEDAYREIRRAVRRACDGEGAILSAEQCEPIDIAGRAADAALVAAWTAVAEGRDASVTVDAVEAAALTLAREWARRMP